MAETGQAHTAWGSIALHLIPGALVTAVYFAIAPAVVRAGYPPLMALLLAVLVILLPFELAVLLYCGRKLNASLSLRGVVLNREPIPIWQYFVIVPILFIWLGAAFTQLGGVDDFLSRHVFAWVPVWAAPSALAVNIAEYSHSALLYTAIAGLVLNGIAGPVVEELYFRGFLLPRIPASRTWAPLINVLLFSLYHFFSPWQNITRIVGLLPMVYVVSWKRNLYLGMITHVLGNLIGMLSLLALALR
jgi:membrane protease YdiL (CAAX protease family)